MYRPPQRYDRIRRAEVAPRMATRPPHNDFETAATKSFGDNRVSACAVKHQAGNNRILPFRFGKNVTHAAQVAFALFAYVTYEEQRIFMWKVEILDRRNDGQQRRNASRIV